MTLAWLFFAFAVVCLFVAVTPGQAMKIVLAGSWLVLGAAAVGSTIYAVGRLLLS
jgi:hypothetical protein